MAKIQFRFTVTVTVEGDTRVSHSGVRDTEGELAVIADFWAANPTAIVEAVEEVVQWS